MASRIPFRRGRSRSGMDASSEASQSQSPAIKSKKKESAWEARRRRKAGATSGSNDPLTKGRRKSTSDLPAEEYDPYDSDPGESYREHVERVRGERSRSCLVLPRFSSSKVDSVPTPSQSRSVSLLDEPSMIGNDGSTPYAPPSLPPDLASVRYSLRTAIGDGSLPQPSVSARRELRPNFVHLNVSHWSDFGKREYMEDRYAIEDLGAVQVEVKPVDQQRQQEVEVTYGQEEQSQRRHRIKMPLTWFGIFDGHGGDKASQFCSDWMSSYVRNEESFPYDLGYAMKKVYNAVDEDFIATGHMDGTTACSVTLVGGRRVICANAGDSRAIIVRADGTVVRLSRDHKPGMPDETRRISALGGRVIYWGRWRVEGLLAVSRSIGDASLKPYVCADPEVCEYDIGKDDWFLVMSSDGVWDVMDNEEAANVVIASSCIMEDGVLKIDTDRFQSAAKNLCEHAKACGSSDNFSCIVADLKSCGNPRSKHGRYQP